MLRDLNFIVVFLNNPIFHELISKAYLIKETMFHTSAMFLRELLRLPVVQLHLLVQQLQLGGEAEDGAACLSVCHLVALLPEVVEVCRHRVWEVHL